jgi:hypothetical protein
MATVHLTASATPSPAWTGPLVRSSAPKYIHSLHVDDQCCVFGLVHRLAYRPPPVFVAVGARTVSSLGPATTGVAVRCPWKCPWSFSLFFFSSSKNKKKGKKSDHLRFLSSLQPKKKQPTSMCMRLPSLALGSRSTAMCWKRHLARYGGVLSMAPHLCHWPFPSSAFLWRAKRESSFCD